MVIKKFNRSESAQKIHAVGIDVKCTSILVGVASPVSKIKLAYGKEKYNQLESAQKNYASRH